MTEALSVNQKPMPAAIENALVTGDLSELSVENRLVYYHRVCESLGLNPLTRPFDYLKLNGKLILYARKDCTDQLRSIRGVSVTDLTLTSANDLITVIAKGKDKEGRMDAATGVVSVKGLAGEALANAGMKAETKAKRRLTLSLCGLGLSDESEVEAIPGAQRVAAEIVSEPKQSKAQVDEFPMDGAAPTPKPSPVGDTKQDELALSIMRSVQLAASADDIHAIRGRLHEVKSSKTISEIMAAIRAKTAELEGK